MASGIVEKAAVENGGNARKFAADEGCDVTRTAFCEREPRSGSCSGEDGPSLIAEISGGGAKIVWLVEVVNGDTVVRRMGRLGFLLEKIGDECSQGAVDADLIRKGFGGEPQLRMMATERCENGCGALDAQLRRSVEGEKQRGMAGLGSCDEGIQLAEAEMLGLINEEQVGLTGEGCRVNLGSGMDAPTVCATEAALVLVQRRAVNERCASASRKDGFCQIIEQQGFAGAGGGRKGEAGVRIFFAFTQDLFFDRLLAGCEKILPLDKSRAVAKRRDEIIGRDKEGVRIKRWIDPLRAQEIGDLFSIRARELVLLWQVFVEAVLVNEGEEAERATEKAEVVVIGTHLATDLFFFVRASQRRFELDVQDEGV